MMEEIKYGWIISLWIDASQIQPNDRDDLPYLSWSPYDRVTIDEIPDFSNFFEIKESSAWNGTVQRLHLIPMRKCDWKLGEMCLIDVQNSKQKPYGIYCIITARFQKRFINIDDLESSIVDTIFRYFENRDVQWQAFRSLGAEDFVGIFLADDIAVLAEAADIFRQLTYTDKDKKKAVFASVYSFFGLNDPAFCQEPKADLFVRLQIKAGFTRQEVRETLEKYLKERFADIFSQISFREVISGKGNLEINIPNHSRVFTCFYSEDKKNKAAVFNGQSDFYKKYIESSRTYWSVKPDNILENEYDIGKFDAYEDHEVENEVSKQQNMHPISRFILKEYERLINSHRCLWWKSILKKQYEVYAEFVKQYADDGNETALCTLNNKVQTVLLHINQATTPFYEVPYHNYYYSGSYNDILRMYYGVIASIFNMAYRLQRSEDTYQYEISYCVDFEAAIKVHSSMYTLKNDARRFVVFHLPYDAFMKFDKTVKLLLHEVFHYVAPYSRAKRNYTFVEIWIILVYEKYMEYLCKNGLTDENSKNIEAYFLKDFGQICENVEDKIEDNLSDKISNDFTTPGKLDGFIHILEMICQEICSNLNENAESYLEEVKACSEYKNAYPNLFDIQTAGYFMESIRRIALAAKEAFCDLNMIYILNMSLHDYVILLFDIFVGKYDTASVSTQLTSLINRKKLSFGSFELRIGMVLDQYYFPKLEDEEPEQYRDLFIKEMEQIESESENNTFQLFCEYLIFIYDQYLGKYRKESPLFKKLFSGESQWFSSFSKGSDEQEILRKAASGPKSIAEHVSVIHDLVKIEIDQKQLNKNRKKSAGRHYYPITCKWEKEHIVVCDLGEYVSQSCAVIQEWNVRGSRDIWFRGLCCDSFKLMPSLFRHLNSELSLYANQADYVKDAYYLTISKSDIWTEKTKNWLAYMCLLQHYGIPTSLLDFTDNMLIALHFALNPDVPEDLQKVDEYIYQPKVVLFNPSIYQKAAESLRKGILAEQAEKLSPFLLDCQDEQVMDYCVHDMSNEYLMEHSQKYLKACELDPCKYLYPKPLAVRRINARIYAQSGTFVAYNLSAQPKTENNKEPDYAYLALESIQQEYLEMLKKCNESLKEGEFLKEIYINKMSIPTIKKQLKTMGVTKARTYPELFRLFGEYMENQTRR